MMNTVFMHWRKAASHRKETVLYLLLLAFMATLYIHQTAINSICMGMLFVYGLSTSTIAEKWELLKSRPAVQLMLLFFLLHVVSTAFSANKTEAIDLLIRRLPLAMFPLALGLITISNRLKNKLVLAFAVVTTLAALYCLIPSLIAFSKFRYVGVLFNNDLLSVYIDKQTNYFGTMVNIAIICFVFYLTTNQVATAWRYTIYGCILFLSIVLFLLTSRMALIAFIVSALAFSGYLIYRYKKWMAGLGILLVLAVEITLSFFLLPDTTGRFKELKHTEYRFSSNKLEQTANYGNTANVTDWNSTNVRLAIWKCGWELAKTHLVIGNPLGDRKERIVDTYASKKFYYGVASKINLHNTFLDVIVTFGVVGFIVFLLAFLGLPVWNNIRSNDFLSCFILLAIGLQLLTESYLDRSIGCILLGFFVSVAEGWKKVKPQSQRAYTNSHAQQPAATYIPG